MSVWLDGALNGVSVILVVIALFIIFMSWVDR